MKLLEFDDCVKKGKIIRFPSAKKMAPKELDVAQEDLVTAQQSLKQKNYKWATVQAYYAMFHAARTLLYHKGYREKSHYCLILAMKAFYVSEGILEMSLVESLQMAKSLREGADYDNTFDSDSAEALVAQAKEFVDVAEKVIFEKKK
ncbi:MAG: HEPN domain-containing protein [Candidatus Omnitrophica bacterium]|nr:HEPN domain-containing protein [Candidatus Omnitrophota bacterium]